MSRGYIPGGMAEAAHILRGKLATVIMRYPSGRYGIVGSVPEELTEEYQSGFTVGRKSQIWDTEEEVITALLGIGVAQFQLSDCSWYQK